MDPVHLVTLDAPREIFVGRWTVTAVSGDGRLEGKATVECHDRYLLAEIQPFVPNI